MWPSPETVFGLVMGGGGSGIIAIVWSIVKDTRARKLVNEESAMGQLRYLKEEAEKDAREAKEDADKRVAEIRADADARVAAAEARSNRSWKIVAWYRANYAHLWRAYKIGPPPGPENFPFSPPPDLE